MTNIVSKMSENTYINLDSIEKIYLVEGIELKIWLK